MYNLNNSHSKKISIGMSLSTDLEYLGTVVTFHGRDGLEISMTEDEWKAFKNEMIVIDAWFDDGLNLLDLAVNPFGQHKIKCITSYNRKAILLEYTGNNPEKDTESRNDSKKARKPYIPAITLQKTSYEGLKRHIPCIDKEIDALSYHETLLEDATQSLIDVIRTVAILESWDLTKCIKEKVYAAGLAYANTTPVYTEREGLTWSLYEHSEDECNRKRSIFISTLLCSHIDHVHRKVLIEVKE